MKASLFLFLALFTAIFTGCGSRDAEKIKFWHFWSEPSQARIVREIVAEFEKQHNCKIEITELSWNDGKTKLIAAFNSNTAPDVLELGSDWVAQFSSAEVLAMLEPKEFNTGRFLRFALEPSFFNGKLYAIPWVVDTRVLFCNKQLMDLVGYSTPPRTFSELIDASRKINEIEGFYGFGANGSDPHRLYKKILPLIWSFGGELVDTNGSISINHSASVQAFTLYFELSRLGIIETQKQIDLLFAQGKIGFCFSGSWLVNMIKSTNPNLNFVVSLIPSTNTHPGTSFAGGEYLAVKKHSKRKELAKEFIKFLSSKDAVVKLCSNVREAGFSSDTSLFEHPSIISDSIRKIFAQQLKFSRMTPVHPKWLEIEPIIENALVEVLYQKKGVYEAISNAQQSINLFNKGISF